MERMHTAVLFLALGCGVDRIGHDGGGTGEAGGDAGGAGADRGGNFPDPAVMSCGDLPAGVTALDGLSSAYVVTGPRSEVGSEGAPVASPETPRFRLASWGMDAGDTIPVFPDPEVLCESGWGFAFDLPLESLAIGIVDLALATPVEAMHATLGFGAQSSCGEGEVGGGENTSDIEAPALSGELEIFLVTPDCVIGELRNVETTEAGEPFAFAIERSGGFVATRAALPCVPAGASTC